MTAIPDLQMTFRKESSYRLKIHQWSLTGKTFEARQQLHSLSHNQPEQSVVLLQNDRNVFYHSMLGEKLQNDYH